MTTTTTLEITHITLAQKSKYVTANEAFNALDAAHGALTHNMASDADYTLSTSTTPQEWNYGIIKITDTGVVLTTNRSIIVPTNMKFYLFVNDTAQTLTLKVSGQVGVDVTPTEWNYLWCNGTDIIEVHPPVST